MPQVSVLMPVRDGAAHLPEAIESLDAQVFDDFEVIVIDDGSQDETPRILTSWARRNPRVTVMSGPHRGIARALIAALGNARAPLVARMDADDVALPDRFLVQVQSLDAHPEITVLGTNIRIGPMGSQITEGMRRYEAWLSSLTTPEELRRDLFVESPLCHPTVMARRHALVEVGGYRDFDGPEDYDLWLRLSRQGEPLANVPSVQLLWRDRPDRATRRDRRYRDEAFATLKLHHLLDWRLAGHRRVGIWGAGPLGKRWSRRLIEKGVEIAFFVEVDRRKIGQVIHGARVIDADGLPQPGELPILVAVGVAGARELIRKELISRGFDEPRDIVYLQ